MGFLESLQEKINNSKKHSLKNLYIGEIGYYVVSNDEFSNKLKSNFIPEKYVFCEELTACEVIEFLKENVDEFTSRFLEMNSNEESNVKYYRIPTENNIILPAPTIEQTLSLGCSTFKAIDPNKMNFQKLSENEELKEVYQLGEFLSSEALKEIEEEFNKSLNNLEENKENEVEEEFEDNGYPYENNDVSNFPLFQENLELLEL